MSIPRDFGAHGKPATFTGSNGNNLGSPKHGVAKGERVAFRNEESREGGPSPMPHYAKAGAFECDESCREYTGNPHDAAGPRGTPAGDHNRVTRR